MWVLNRKLGAACVTKLASTTGADRRAVLQWAEGSALPTPRELRRIDEFYYRLLYTQEGNSPGYWRAKGRELLRASRLLKASVDDYWRIVDERQAGNASRPLPPLPPEGQMLMLRSFAIECFLKAAILNSGVDLFVDGKQVLHTHHKLTALAGAVGLTLSKPENEMLERLNAYTWLGRFPVLDDWKKSPSDESRSDREGRSHWREPEDEKLLETVLKKINENFKNKKKGC